MELNASPALSPDGTQIAFAGSAKGNADIYVVSTSGGVEAPDDDARARSLARLVRDGAPILYTSDQSGTPQIWVMDAEGTARGGHVCRQLER